MMIKFIYSTKKELDDFKGNLSNIICQKKVLIKEIHKPVKGILTFKGRSNPIGLWEISLK